jgi:hypothetical protein
LKQLRNNRMNMRQGDIQASNWQVGCLLITVGQL